MDPGPQFTSVAGRYLNRQEDPHRKDPLSQLVRAAKTDRSHDVFIADALAHTHRRSGLERPDVIVSPPAHAGREDRFSNVRAHLADQLGVRAAPLPLHEQTGAPSGYRTMGVAQRMQQPRRIEANATAVAGKRILIVDDVVTSGAQIHAVRHALLRAGASDVQAVALTRAQGLR